MTAAGGSAAIVRGVLQTMLHLKGVQSGLNSEPVLNKLNDTITESKTRERMPDRLRQLLNNIVDGGQLESVQIPFDKWQTYFQSAGLDPASMASAINAKNYREAQVTGEDLVIPFGDYAVNLAGSDHEKALVGDTRLGIGMDR